MEKINWETGTFCDGEIRYYRTTWKDHKVEFNGYDNPDEERKLFVNKRRQNVTKRMSAIRSITPADLDRFIML